MDVNWKNYNFYNISLLDSQDRNLINGGDVIKIIFARANLTDLFNKVINELSNAKFCHFKVSYSKEAFEKGESSYNEIQNIFLLNTPNEKGFFQTISFDNFHSSSGRGAITENLKWAVYEFTHEMQAACVKFTSQYIAAIKICENTFSPEIFGNYRLKLKEFALSIRHNFPSVFSGIKLCGTPFLDVTQRIIDQVLYFNPDHIDNYRNAHKELLKSLRFAIIEYKRLFDFINERRLPALPLTGLEIEAKYFIDEIHFWIYTNNALAPLWQQKWKQFLPNLESMTTGGFEDSFWNVYNELKNQLSGSYRTLFSDYHSMGNFPVHLFNISTTQFIRMPNQIIYKQLKSQVLPEFLNFIRMINVKGKKFLYANMMSTDPKEEERSFSEQLHQLESYYPATKVITFDRNSRYAFAIDEFSGDKNPELYDVEKYIQDLTKRLCSEWKEKSPFVINFNLSKDPIAFEQKISSIIVQVHEYYFKSDLTKNPTILNDKDRKIFNELVLIEIVYQMIKENKYDYMTAACRASVDRGPTFFALLYIRDRLNEGGGLNTDQIREALFILFINGMMIENRTPYEPRLEVFFNATNKMIMQGVLHVE